MQSNNRLIDSLRVFANCDSSSYISASESQELVIKKGYSNEHYGWAENSVLNPPCCGRTPPKDALKEREHKIRNLANSFSLYLGAILPDVESKDDLNKIDAVKEIILSEINASHIGFETFDRLRPRNIADFNSEVLRIRNWLTRNAAWQCEIAKELVQIRKILVSHDLSEEDISIIVKTYCDRAKDKLTSVEVERNFDRVSQSNKDNIRLQRSLATILLKTQEKAKAYDWGTLTPPTDPAVSIACSDFCILYNRLLASFPGQYCDRHATIPQFEGDLELTCQDLMDTAKMIMNAVHDDLRKWGEESEMSQKDMAALLVRQPGWSEEQGVAPYLYRAFFFLPMSYHMIFNLGEKSRIENPNLDLVPHNWKDSFFDRSTIQSSWRNDYHDCCEKVMDLVGRKNLEVADSRFTKWTTMHTDEWDFSRAPDTMPT